MTADQRALRSEYITFDSRRVVILRNGGSAQRGSILMSDSPIVREHVELDDIDIVIVELEICRASAGVPYRLVKGGSIASLQRYIRVFAASLGIHLSP